MKVPVKYSDAEARSLLATKLKDKSLSVGDRRKLEDQLQSYYAKGGVVKKKTKIGVVKKKKV